VSHGGTESGLGAGMAHPSHEFPDTRPSAGRHGVPGVAQIVKVEVLEAHRFSCLAPSPKENGPAKRPLASVKEPTPGSRFGMFGKMSSQLFHHEGWDAHNPAPGLALRWADKVATF
jgi:hypothetical protein